MAGIGDDPFGLLSLGGLGDRNSDCPVCGIKGAVKAIEKIVDIVREGGGFQVRSANLFWQMFRQDMCWGCRSSFDSIQSNKREARDKLKEAVKLGFGQAKKNLKVVEKMLED